jgi:RimJ/RimL family protein N-acetyltransferase
VVDVSPEDVPAFVERWLAAWNAHDVEAVLAHFTEDVEFTSPVAARVMGGDGVVRGKAALRDYWVTALSGLPDLHFELVGAYVGVDTVTINYRNQRGGLVCEVLTFEGDVAVRGQGTYLAAAAADVGAADGARLELRGEQVTLVPVTAEHVPELRRIRRAPEVEARWGAEALLPPWPFDDPEAVVFAVLGPAGVLGMVQYSEEDEPGYRHASIDLFLDPAIHSQGVGRDAVQTLAAYLVDERGHHRITIDPAADNAAAIRCYAAAGFRPVGVLRDYERDHGGPGWHDGLLMELLAADLPRTSATAG